MKEWLGFKEGNWQKEIDLKNFIETNYQVYEGDDSFLKGISPKTQKVWDICSVELAKELERSVLAIDPNNFSGINNFNAGYIDRENEVIVGLQTDQLLKRIVNPYGGTRMVDESLKAYGFVFDINKYKLFKEIRKTHNQGVFDAYPEEVRSARRVGLITGLPDAYGRGRIIGDYRRVALYGVDFLIEDKKNDLAELNGEMTEDVIRLREEVSMQIRALEELKEMALKYEIDISKPATNAKEAAQWLYFAYLASTKENNGAAMSLGRIDSFLDIYINRDLEKNLITEEEAQELIDQLVIKLRVIRHLRTPEYDELFSGDPTWVTCAIGGLATNESPLVTKTSFRLIHTLDNLMPAPEPNMTVLWSEKLPEKFKEYCSKMSIITDAIQYENDDLMKPLYGSDYAIACCVSAMRIGKDMQFFGARCNLGKALLYAINGGVDEITKAKVLDVTEAISDEYLDYDKVMANYDKVLEKMAEIYVKAMNIIHFMHDKYAYESIQLALHDTHIRRLMAYGIAGLSVATDSFSAIKYGKVKVIRDEDNLAVDFEVEGDFPRYGNDDDRADDIAKMLTSKVFQALSSHKCYREAVPTMSVLTITSNVVYGIKTGSTPDGRKKGEAFAPGANPMHGSDLSGAIASLNSVAKLKYTGCCEDGISNTFSIVPSALGADQESRVQNLVSILDGYFSQGAHHLNVNVLNKEMLMDAMENPNKYPLLTIRVSGYAVRFNRLTKKQQEEVISRTFHERI